MLLAIDAHLDKYVVRRQLDGQEPQPAQTFRSDASLLRWAGKQVRLAGEVHSVYEAGPLGFTLHRKLAGIGVSNYVVKPKVLDEEGRRRKSDKLDTLGLVRDLDRYVRGNRLAMCVVRVPTVGEELPRSQTRVRHKLVGNRKRFESQGRGMLLFYGYHFKGTWWKKAKWEKEVRVSIPEELAGLLAGLREIILKIDATIAALTRRIEESATREIPKGLGRLTSEIIEREVIDWNRFARAKKVGSYTGMCPGEDSSGGRERKLSITKSGNPLLRHALVEAAWRLVRFQPGYRAVKAFYAKVAGGRIRGKAARKRALVALARQFAVDWWKVRTGRAKPEDLGLVMVAPKAAADTPAG